MKFTHLWNLAQSDSYSCYHRYWHFIGSTRLIIHDRRTNSAGRSHSKHTAQTILVPHTRSNTTPPPPHERVIFTLIRRQIPVPAMAGTPIIYRFRKA